jgi:serine protease
MTSRAVFRYSAAAVGAITAVAAVGIVVASSPSGPATGSAAPFTPSVFGLDTAPDDLLPDRISATRPVTVVSTVLDASGRPVVTRHRAADRASAEAFVVDAQQAPYAIGVELDVPVRVATVTGDDPYRSMQWDLTTLDATTSWSASTGAGATVAVIDTGVDAAHPDLAGHVLPGVDLITGDEGASIDPHGHGTHVAGTIAAVTGNATGVSGFAPEAMILPIRVLSADGSGVMSDVATALVVAADRGADVVNLSLGSTEQAGSVTTAIAYARSKGVVVVAAAGNSRGSGSPANYPAADAGVLGVAATDSSDQVASFSNQGSYVDVAAPGVDILSTVPAVKGDYAFYSGTSMAAPHVAALAAQLRAADPQLTPDEVQAAIEATAVDLGAAGRDVDFGSGRIRPVQALAALAPPSAAPSSSAAPSVPAAPSTPATTAPESTPPVTPSATSTITPTATPTATPTSVPTSPPPIVRPVVTSAAKSRPVDYGTIVTTVFTVLAQGQPWAGRPVAVCVSVAGGTWSCPPGTTTAQGTVRHVRTATGTYRVRVRVAATSTSSAVASATYVFTTRASAHLARTGARTLRAVVDGAVGQGVSVQRRQGAAWVTVTTYRAVSSRTLTGLRPGYRYRVVVAGTPSITGAHSGTVAL